MDGDYTLRDVYRLPIGIRKISWSNTNVFINNKPIYIRGVGKHEDSDVRQTITINNNNNYTFEINK